MEMDDTPKLQVGFATCKKKADKKSVLMEVDKKALEQSIFIEQIEMFGSKWNRFEDVRGWIWVQEAD